MKRISLRHPLLQKLLNSYTNGWSLYYGKWRNYAARTSVHLLKQRLKQTIHSTIEVDIWQRQRDQITKLQSDHEKS
jgi:hypothetical protein